MKHLFSLKTFLITCISVIIGGGSAAAQETETIDFSTLGYENEKAVPTYVGEKVTLTYDKGTHTTGLSPTYYTKDATARIYKGNTMVVSSETDIEKILITYAGTSYAKLTAEGLSNSGKTGTWSGKSKSITFVSEGTSRITKIEVSLALAEGAVAAPVISPEAGMFDGSQEVTITPADASHTVWYTTDGTEPTNAAPSIKYTAPFTIDATTTVKAIATDGTKVSSVVSAIYTKKEWLSDLSALVAKIKEDNSTSDKEYYVNLTGAVVTGVLGTYNAYLEEGETGVLLNESNHGLTLAQKYSGKATVSAKMKNGTPLLTAFDCATVVEGAELPLATITLAELTTNFDKYLSRRVKVEDVTVTSELTGKQAEIKQGETTFAVYTNDGDITIAKNAIVDIIGWPNLYNTTKQLSIWAQTDITNKGVATVFYFSTDAVSVRIDGSVDKPELTNTYEDKAVTYTSSNTEVATVNATTGEVTLVGVGKTTITAALANGPSAFYTLTVTAIPVKKHGNYYLVTSADELVAGACYMIVAKDGEKTYVMAAQKSSNRGQAEVAVEEDLITNPGADACELVLEAGTKIGTWAFYDEANSGYLYAASSSSNHLKIEGPKSANSSATIEFDASGNATIKFQGENTRNWLRYNSGSDLFSCYASGQQDVQLYKLYTEFSIGTDGYASCYTDKAFVMPEGVEGGIITAANGDKLTIEYNYPAGATVPAKTALLLKGTTGKYAYELSASEELAPAGNLLHGGDAVDGDGKMYVEGTDVKYYVLSKKNDANLGFYWAAADGAPVAYQAGKAFLAVDYGTAGVNAFSMFSLDGEATGIESTEAVTAGDGKVYTLTGVCVGNNVKALPKGIYIVNGKKVAF